MAATPIAWRSTRTSSGYSRVNVCERSVRARPRGRIEAHCGSALWHCGSGLWLPPLGGRIRNRRGRSRGTTLPRNGEQRGGTRNKHRSRQLIAKKSSSELKKYLDTFLDDSPPSLAPLRPTSLLGPRHKLEREAHICGASCVSQAIRRPTPRS